MAEVHFEKDENPLVRVLIAFISSTARCIAILTIVHLLMLFLQMSWKTEERGVTATSCEQEAYGYE